MKHIVAIGTVILLGAAIGLPRYACAGSESSNSKPVHQGFYFNADVGLGGSHYNITGPRDNLDVSGAAANVDFRFGYALTRHLVLSLDLNGTATVKNPDTRLNGSKLYYSNDTQYGTAMIGVGLTWYFDNNLFLGGTIGTAQLSVHQNNTDINSDNGFGAQVRFGKEWWVGDDWGLGVVGGLSYASANANSNLTVNSPSGSYTAYFDHAEATTAFIAFTATFN